MIIKKGLSKGIRKLFTVRLFESIICFFSQNKSLGSFIGRLVPENTFYKTSTIRNVRRNNINFCLDISDYQNWLVYFGLNEDRPIGLYNLVKKNSVIIDVGSNIGQTAMTFAQISSENSLIYGFEPDPINYTKAVGNLKLNKFKNIVYKNIGLGSSKGELPLKIDTPANRGGNRIDLKNVSENSVRIEIERFDDVILELKIDKIDLVKIDVEGFELEVLKGAENSLKIYKPLLFIEIDDRNLSQQGASARELLNYLNKIGYTCIQSESGKTIRDNSLELNNCHFDMICSFIQ